MGKINFNSQVLKLTAFFAIVLMKFAIESIYIYIYIYICYLCIKVYVFFHIHNEHCKTSYQLNSRDHKIFVHVSINPDKKLHSFRPHTPRELIKPLKCSKHLGYCYPGYFAERVLQPAYFVAFHASGRHFAIWRGVKTL